MTIDAQAVRAQAAQAWASDPKLRAEFGQLEAFAAWSLAIARGQAREAPYGAGAVVALTAAQARPSIELKGTGEGASVRLNAPLQFAAAAAAAALPQRFTGVAYSGALVQSLGIVIDLASTRYDSRLPVLDNHARSIIVGVIEEASTKSHQMHVAGRLFSDMVGSAAERIAQLAHRGAPFQMSVGLYDYAFESIAAGSTAQVNGQAFEGPVEILRNGHVREVSIVTLGADSNARAAFFAQP